MTIDKLYEHPTLVAVYESTSGWAEDCDFYLSRAQGAKLDILDIGCGTGLLCDAYAADGHNVVGVDPAGAMLEVAKKKPHGDRVQWIESNGQDLRYGKQFDLIIMTGHAFQCLLSDVDVHSLFSNVRRHLKQHGTFIFDSRNPNVNWSLKWDGSSAAIDSELGKFTMSTKVLSANEELITFAHRYDFKHESLSSVSTIRFHALDAIQEMIASSGLALLNLYGDFKPSPFFAGSSSEMIFEVSRN